MAAQAFPNLWGEQGKAFPNFSTRRKCFSKPGRPFPRPLTAQLHYKGTYAVSVVLVW
jgi:hypothetical protein